MRVQRGCMIGIYERVCDVPGGGGGGGMEEDSPCTGDFCLT